MCFSTQKALSIIPPLSNVHIIAKDIHLIAYIQCDIERKKCVTWHGVEYYKNGHKSARNDLNIISCLSKTCWR